MVFVSFSAIGNLTVGWPKRSSRTELAIDALEGTGLNYSTTRG